MGRAGGWDEPADTAAHMVAHRTMAREVAAGTGLVERTLHCYTRRAGHRRRHAVVELPRNQDTDLVVTAGAAGAAPVGVRCGLLQTDVVVALLLLLLPLRRMTRGSLLCVTCSMNEKRVHDQK